MKSLDYYILFGYFAVLIGIGWYAARKHKNLDSYFVGGRKTGTFSLMTLWMASWIGGASFVGSANKAYAIGLSSLWYPVGIALGCLLFGITTAGKIKQLGDKFNHLTYSDFIEERYGVPCRIICTITTFLAYLGYTASQLLSAATIITMLAGWSLGTSFLLVTLITVFYSSVGGFLALDYTNRFQALFMLFGVAGCAVPVMLYNTGGVAAFSTALPPAYYSWGNWELSAVLGLVLSTILTFYTSMDSYTRCYSAQSTRSARNGTLLSALLVLVIGVAVCIVGMGARILHPHLPPEDNALAWLILNIFPQGIKGVLLVTILAAVMSTANACMLTGSACLTRDLYQRFYNPSISECSITRLSIFCTLLVGVLSAFVAWNHQDIIGLLSMAFTLNSAGLFLPTMGVFYWKWASRRAAFWSMSVSLAIVLLWYSGNASFPHNALFSIAPVWPGLLASAILFFSISYLYRHNKEHLNGKKILHP